MKKHLVLMSLATSFLLADTFTLGQIDVEGMTKTVDMSGQTVSAKQIQQTNSATLSQALDNVSGISVSAIGARAESTISIRGFDSNHILVFADGVPLYMPYDGEFDYNRVLTNGISQIDISKGYSSVAYGANAMGGVINIISKKPTKKLQGDIHGGIVLDSQAKLSRYVTSFNVGTRQKHYYIQVGGVYSDQDHYRLSDGYSATPSQSSGDRLRSKAEDYSANAKVGYMADDASEIAVGYAIERGKKEEPPSTDPSLSKVRYWDWPVWDTSRYYVTGQKNFGNSYLKTTVYYSTYKNKLFSYDNATYTTMNYGYAFKSLYDDYNYGARFQYAIQLAKHFITASLNYQKNVHRGYDIDKVTDAKSLSENYEDHTISIGLSDNYTISPKWQVLAGVSEDIVKADKIWDTTTAYNNMMKLTTQSSFNPETAVIYSIDRSSKIKASIARKIFIPTMKDRYSRRFNSYVPNPGLQPSKSTNYELDYKKQTKHITASVAAFYTVVDDAIQSVAWDQNASLEQEQNIGNIRHIGAEVDLSYKTDRFSSGANYTYISVKNTTDSSIKVVGVPKHQVFAYGKVNLNKQFALYGNMKLQDGFYNQITDYSYVKSSFTTFSAKLIYQPFASLQADIGVKNITDRVVQYDLGFPGPGREYFADLTYKF